MLDADSVKKLLDYYPFQYGDADEMTVIVNEKEYKYEMTLSPHVPDEICCRVMIDGEYYYFS